jgi:hypothetical protein
MSMHRSIPRCTVVAPWRVLHAVGRARQARVSTLTAARRRRLTNVNVRDEKHGPRPRPVRHFGGWFA